MFHIPTSSPMMTTMLGCFAEASPMPRTSSIIAARNLEQTFMMFRIFTLLAQKLRLRNFLTMLRVPTSCCACSVDAWMVLREPNRQVMRRRRASATVADWHRNNKHILLPPCYKRHVIATLALPEIRQAVITADCYVSSQRRQLIWIKIGSRLPAQNCGGYHNFPPRK